MEHGPVPPHERPWRHPSELAAADRAAFAAEPPSRRLRLVALLGGAAAAIIVIATVVTVTPWRGTNGSAGTDDAATAMRTAAEMPLLAPRSEWGHPLVVPISVAWTSGESALLAVADAQMLRSMYVDLAPETRIVVQLIDGPVVFAEVLDLGGDERPAILRLDPTPETIQGYVVAPDPPDAFDDITILIDDPVTMEFRFFVNIEVPAGTAVIDEQGRLIGLGRVDDGRTRLIVVGSATSIPG